MPLGLILGLGRAFRRKRTSSLDILTSKRGPRDYYKGKNCIPTGFHTRKGGYVVVQEKLPNYVVPDLTDFKEIGFTSDDFGLGMETIGLKFSWPSHLLKRLKAWQVEAWRLAGQAEIASSVVLGFITGSTIVFLKPYVSQCPIEVSSTEAADS
ncbi:unnamed protein product, partial [Ilex paraguariensis]